MCTDVLSILASSHVDGFICAYYLYVWFCASRHRNATSSSARRRIHERSSEQPRTITRLEPLGEANSHASPDPHPALEDTPMTATRRLPLRPTASATRLHCCCTDGTGVFKAARMADNHASGSLRSSSGKGERDIMPRPLISLISVTRRASPYEWLAVRSSSRQRCMLSAACSSACLFSRAYLRNDTCIYRARKSLFA